MSDDLLADLLDAVDAKEENWSPHAPHPKQAEFLGLTCREALFGGAAGGGKSDALLMAALQYVHVPGYAALLLRKSYGDLSLAGALMDRLNEWLKGTRARWRAVEKRWVFPSGATITFGFCQHKLDLNRYFGTEFQFVGIDELTQWPEQWYRMLHRCLRKPEHMKVPLRFRSASNPGSIGHQWVKARFIDGGEAGAVFVPSQLKDNPSVDESYLESLQVLDATTRKQLMDGIWIEDSAGLVYKCRAERNSCEQVPEDLTEFLLGIDFGVRDACAFVVLGWRKQDPTVYVVEVIKETDLDPTGAALVVKELMRRYPFTRMVGDVGGLGKAFAQEMINRHGLPIEAAEKHNKLGYQRLINGEFERGLIKLWMPMCEPLSKELLELPLRLDGKGESDGFDNHAVDACLYAWRASTAFRERVPEPPLPLEERLRIADLEVEQAEDEAARMEMSGPWWQPLGG